LNIYIVELFLRKLQFSVGGEGEGKPMKALTGHQYIMGNLLNAEYE
jgi:hypothetical protein